MVELTQKRRVAVETWLWSSVADTLNFHRPSAGAGRAVRFDPAGCGVGGGGNATW